MLKRLLSKWVLKHILKALVIEDLLYLDSKTQQIYLGRELISDEELKTLVEEAKFLHNTRLWSVMTNTIRADANERMFYKAKSFDDMFFGKAMTYNISVMEKIVALLKTK